MPPRSRDMNTATSSTTPTLMTVVAPKSSGSHNGEQQYSDDEKSTVCRITQERKPKKSAMKSAQPRNARKSKRIGFSSYDEIMEIPHIHDLTPEEIADVWMNDEEFRSIRRECLGTVGDLGDAKVSDGFLLRGLDQHTCRYKAARDFIGRQLYDAVLSVQEFEKANGIDCSELMAQMSIKYSEPSVIAAQSAAISDIFSSFKDSWTHRSIPTIPDGPLVSGVWNTQC